jgi:hypothetical protein
MARCVGGHTAQSMATVPWAPLPKPEDRGQPLLTLNCGHEWQSHMSLQKTYVETPEPF